MRRKNYLWYQFWRHIIVGNGLKFFYSSVKVKGKEKLPKGKPILYIPNHQNSFMDALHVATTTKPVIYFLTRAQAFKPDIVGKFLWSINMLPVYRVRDGLKSVQKNNEIFELCIDYLKNKDTVLIFAEANHNLKRRIRSLSKGFTRIAFGAEDKLDWKLDLQIVPVGINYSEHRTGGNLVQVNYGDPIPAKEYKSIYLENEKTATEKMKQDVSEAMKKLVFHVEDLEEYPIHEILWDHLEPNRTLVIDPDIANGRIKKTKPFVTEDLIEQAKTLNSLAKKYNVSLCEVNHGKQVILKDIFLSPLYGFSFLNNIIPYQPVRHLISNTIKDHAFDASIKFLAGIFLFPLFYGVISLALYLGGVNSLWIWGYLLASILSAPLFVRAKTLFSPSSANTLKKKNPNVYTEMKDQISAFLKIRDKILGK